MYYIFLYFILQDKKKKDASESAKGKKGKDGKQDKDKGKFLAYLVLEGIG